MMLQKSAKDSAVTISLLIGAAICEVCGGWCIWKWRREGWHWWIAIFGSVVLITSGILPTLQKQEFNRTYALYGGFFIVASFLWGWALDKAQPDLWDAIGSVITLVGVLLIMFAPHCAGTREGLSDVFHIMSPLVLASPPAGYTHTIVL